MKRLFTTLFALAVALTGPGLFTQSEAQVVETVDYVFPDPNTPLGEPDPSVWASSGGLSPVPQFGVGLQIADPDNAASLLYFHASTELAIAANNATFQALVKTPVIPDASGGWSNDTTGFRLILDDSRKRLVLTLGRDPATNARQVVVMGAAGVAPIPFPWDNDYHNVYEIARLPNGDFSVNLTNNDPLATAPPVTKVVPAASLPASTGAAMFGWGMGAAGGGLSFWQETHGVVSASQIDIALDTKKLEIEPGADGEIEWTGAFTLPAGTTIDPITEGFSMELVSGGATVFETMIGPVSFIQRLDGSFRFESAPGTTPRVKVRLKPLGGSLWEFRVAAEDLLLTVADRTQATGTLAIGNKVGTQTLPLTDKGKELVFKKP